MLLQPVHTCMLSGTSPEQPTSLARKQARIAQQAGGILPVWVRAIAWEKASLMPPARKRPASWISPKVLRTTRQPYRRMSRAAEAKPMPNFGSGWKADGNRARSKRRARSWGAFDPERAALPQTSLEAAADYSAQHRAERPWLTAADAASPEACRILAAMDAGGGPWAHPPRRLGNRRGQHAAASPTGRTPLAAGTSVQARPWASDSASRQSRGDRPHRRASTRHAAIADPDAFAIRVRPAAPNTRKSGRRSDMPF